MSDGSSGSGKRSGIAAAVAVAQWALMGLTVGLVAWIAWTRRADLAQLLDVSPLLLGLISVSTIATFLVNGIEMKVLVERFGTKLALGETMRLGLMVSTLNYLPMKAGTVLLGVVMRTRHKVRLPHFAALIAGSSVIHLWVGCTLAGALLATGGRLDALTWGLLGVPTGTLVALIVWGNMGAPDRPTHGMSAPLRAALRVVEGLRDIFGDPVLLAKEVAINLVLVLLASARTAWAFEAMSTDVGLDKAIVITAVAIVSARLSVIPGGLGFREGGAAAGAVAVGLGAGLGLASAVIDRAVNLVWLLLLGIPATLYVQRATGLHLHMSLTGSEVEGDGDAASAPAATDGEAS